MIQKKGRSDLKVIREANPHLMLLAGDLNRAAKYALAGIPRSRRWPLDAIEHDGSCFREVSESLASGTKIDGPPR